MYRRMRRISRKFQRNLSDVKSAATNLFGRSTSYTGPSFESSYRTSAIVSFVMFNRTNFLVLYLDIVSN